MTHMTPEKGIVTGNKLHVKTLCTFTVKARAEINYYIHQNLLIILFNLRKKLFGGSARLIEVNKCTPRARVP